MEARFFINELKDIMDAQIDDLKTALLAHDGKYEWGEDEGCSIVVIEWEDLVANFEVTSAEIDEDGDVLLGGRTTEGIGLILWAGNVRVGDLAYITDSIPEKKAVEA